MEFQSHGELCYRRTPTGRLFDQRRHQAMFVCGDVVYRLKPTKDGLVRGTIFVRVTEGFREQGPCIRWEVRNGEAVCVRYDWVVEREHTTKSTPIWVTSFETGSAPASE